MEQQQSELGWVGKVREVGNEDGANELITQGWKLLTVLPRTLFGSGGAAQHIIYVLGRGRE
jgi:hypothetical protein